jgi:hypothetical protein
VAPTESAYYRAYFTLSLAGLSAATVSSNEAGLKSVFAAETNVSTQQVSHLAFF